MKIATLCQVSVLPRQLALLTLLLLSTVVVGCGGGSSGDTNPESTTSPPTAVASPATATPTAPSSGTPATARAKPLRDLDSFQYAYVINGDGGPVHKFDALLQFAGKDPGIKTLEGIGAYIEPDMMQYSYKVGQLLYSQTIIKDQEWLLFAGQRSGPTRVDDFTVKNASLQFAIGFWDNSGLIENFGKFTCSADLTEINGTQARTCLMEEGAFQESQGTLKGVYHLDNVTTIQRYLLEVAISQDGYPVRIRYGLNGQGNDGKDFKFSFEMSFLNLNGSFPIKAPF